MLITVIVGALCGAAVQTAHPKVAEFLARHLEASQLPDAPGLRVVSFALMMCAASALLLILDTRGSTVLLLVSGLVGYFHRQIRDVIAARRR
ncbi:hypothetical protein IMCC21224_112204 [Puniceibacterium sp. IMCC21224]|nr:hypothetical protein IMCC21224_112204 [Puniceibacterium sp. IMCC21224]